MSSILARILICTNSKFLIIPPNFEIPPLANSHRRTRLQSSASRCHFFRSSFAVAFTVVIRHLHRLRHLLPSHGSGTRTKLARFRYILSFFVSIPYSSRVELASRAREAHIFHELELELEIETRGELELEYISRA